MNYGFNGGYPDYGSDFSKPDKVSLKEYLNSGGFAPLRELFLTSCILGLAFVGYAAISNIFSFVLLNVPAFYNGYVTDAGFSYLCEAVYTFMCVGLPFSLVYLMLKASGRYYGELSLSSPYSLKTAIILIVAGLGICSFGNIVTSWFSVILQSFGVNSYSYQAALSGEISPDTASGFAAFLLRTAVVPALIEEFAFRGVVLQTLRKYGDFFAIVISAVMFGLMHGNMTQVPFALIAGFALGYCYVVTGSLWVTVIIHFLNNFTAVAANTVIRFAGEGIGTLFSAFVIYAAIFVGIAAAVVYIVKNPRFSRLYPGEYPGLKKKGLAFFIAPTVLAAVIFLVSLMKDDILLG